MIVTDNKMRAARKSWIGFIVLVITGALLHFAFEFSGGNTLVGAFTPVNESVWEHLKLILFPGIAIGIAEYFIYGKYNFSFPAIKVIAILAGMLTIVLGYYTYSGILGRDIPAVNIGLFVLACAVTTYLTYRLSIAPMVRFSETFSIYAVVFLTAVIILFIYFTFHPPMLEIFRDPVTEDFGITALLPYC